MRLRRFRLLLVLVILSGLAAGAALAATNPFSPSRSQPNQPQAQLKAVAQGERTGRGGAADASSTTGPAAVKSTAAGTPTPAAQSRPGQEQVPPGGQGAEAARGRGQSQGATDARTRPVVGSITAVEGDTATVSTQQGEVKVRLSGARVQKMVEGAIEDLKAGQRVTIQAEQGADGVYAAGSVQIMPAGETAAAPGLRPTTPTK